MAAYTVLADLYAYGLPLAAMGSVSTGVQQKCLDGANDGADDKLRARYRLPLRTPYPESLKRNICHIAAYDVLVIRGFSPTVGADKLIVDRAEAARKWFDDVERQRAHPNVIEAAGADDPGYAAPLVISKPQQGW